MALHPNSKAEPARTPVRSASAALRKGEYLGRNGKIIRREKAASHDPYHIPESVQEDGWSYQWCRADVIGSSEFSEISVMRRAGWDFVKPDQLNGYFAESCKDRDNVEIMGLVLMERPAQMTQDAKDEQLREANKQFLAQINKRADNDTPLPSGVLPMMREVHQEAFEANPSAHKPTYARVTAPAGDDE